MTDKLLRLVMKGDDKGMMATLGAVTGALATATAAALALKKGFDFAEEGAGIERLRDSGEALAKAYGTNMADIIATMKKASGGTITEMQAMERANNAMLLGVARSPAEFEKLTKAAIALGRATGRDAAESIDDVTVGVGRMSKKILDNLGIVYDANTVYEAWAIRIGKAGEQLSDLEKKQSLVNLIEVEGAKLLDEHGDLIRDNASEYERLTANVKDYTDALKESWAEGITPAIKRTNDLWESLSLVENAYDSGYISQKQYRDMTADLNNWKLNLGDTIEEVTSRIQSEKEAFIALNPEIAQNARQTQAAAIATEELGVNVNAAREMMRRFNTEIGDALDAGSIAFMAGDVNGLAAALERLIAAERSAGRLSGIQQLIADVAAAGGVESMGVPASYYEGRSSTSGGRDEMIRDQNTGQLYHVTDAGWKPVKGATGGTFKVGGSGGTDSQPVNMQLTPGETVTVGGGTSDMENILAEVRSLVKSIPTAIADAVERR